MLYGDPLSPILFCLAEDFLNRLFLQAIASGHVTTMHALGKLAYLFHLLYTYDILFFYQSTKFNIKCLADIFSLYGHISGQRVSWSKSAAYFGSKTFVIWLVLWAGICLLFILVCLCLWGLRGGDGYRVLLIRF